MTNTADTLLTDELKNDDFGFIYSGMFDNAVLGMATDLIKNHVEQVEHFEGKRNKLSFLMAESFQNILRYGIISRADDCTNGEIFIVRHQGDSIYITTGNFVENKSIESVKDKLERVNGLSSDELKKLYVKILTDKKLSSRGGAGLGFVEMVRKTGEKLDFDFVKLDEQRSFFYFQLRLRENNTPLPETVTIEDAKRIKNIMESQHRIICMKGAFNDESIIPVLQMTESNIDAKTSGRTIQRKVYHILVELLQNISKHAYVENDRRNGIFSMGECSGAYTVCAANKIEINQAEKLKRYINFLNSKSKTQLNDYYKQILRDGHSDASIESGLGLIDIARDSVVKIDYHMEPIDSDLVNLSITAKV